MEFLKGLPMLHFQICQHFATRQVTSSMAWTTKHEDSSQGIALISNELELAEVV